MSKIIFITGGVVSGIGKSSTTASIGRLFKSRGYDVRLLKMEPYFNVDTRHMSPLQHGEVYVTDDGEETDMCIGHYERMLGRRMRAGSNVTTGQVYWEVLSRERRGDYDGGTVQVIPHITNMIKEHIYRAAEDTDILIVEIGGTVGDIESQPFIEAIREVSVESGLHDTAFVHVTLAPYIPSSGELKSKPTQHSVKELLGGGVQPDVLICRTERPMDDSMKSKIVLFCNMRPQDVIACDYAENEYELPLMLNKAGLVEALEYHLRLEHRDADLKAWEEMIGKIRGAVGEVTVGIVGNYVNMRDAYHSVFEALAHGGFENGVNVSINWISTKDVAEKGAAAAVYGCDGIVSVGGLREDGFDQFVEVSRYARECGIPFLGIDIGMQAAAVDIARNIIGMTGAGSTEFGECDAVIDAITDENGKKKFLIGAEKCVIEPNTRAAAVYGAESVSERNRCKYVLSPAFARIFNEAGVQFSMVSEDGDAVEAIEIPAHRWFMATQFLPQFTSRPNHPHPIIVDFVRELKAQNNNK